MTTSHTCDMHIITSRVLFNYSVVVCTTFHTIVIQAIMVSLICYNTGLSGLSNVYAQELQTQGMKVHMYMHISGRPQAPYIT